METSQNRMAAESVRSRVTLNDGVSIPIIGYGSRMFNNPTEEDYFSVKSYLKSAIIDCGYIHLDTAELYKSEKLIGRALKELNIDRRKIFLTSKILPKDVETRIDRNETIKIVNNSLKNLQTKYIDLYLIHSPHSFDNDGQDIIEIYLTLLELQKQGKIRSVGVSNFGVNHLKIMIEKYKLQIPSVNQIELHPFCHNIELLEYCKKYNIFIEAYSPLYKGKNFKFRGFKKEINCFKHPVLMYIANNHNKNPAQIMLRWSIQNGYIAITKSKKPERIKNNINIFDFKLNSNEMKIINLLNEGETARIYPENIDAIWTITKSMFSWNSVYIAVGIAFALFTVSRLRQGY